jgi:hypothetical protein
MLKSGASSQGEPLTDEGTEGEDYEARKKNTRRAA